MNKVDRGLSLRYYKKKEVQEQLVNLARNKEIGMHFDGYFGKRPDILVYPTDVLELAKQGICSFHCSEELWENSLELNPNLKKKEIEKLRIGWDLVLDIDCAQIEYSKICADLVIKFLKYCGVKDISCKFSGNKGFHIAVPFEAFPTHVGESETRNLFPQAARKMAAYISENIKEELSRRILLFENNDISKIKEKVGLNDDKLIRYERNKFGDRVAKLEIENFLEIDTILISTRHLYRMPYSLHEKSGLISLPIDPDKVMDFVKPMADPDKFLAPVAPFLNREVTEQSARRLLVQALDFKVKSSEKFVVEELKEELKKKRAQEEIKIESPVTADLFPPCMQTILKGMEDGKKRSVFAFILFLGRLGWEKMAIQQFLMKWNSENNPEPLRENYILGQMRYFKKDGALPPNCDNPAYYTGLGICQPDGLCRKIKNPVNYSVVKLKIKREEDLKQEKRERREERRKLREEEQQKKADLIRKEREEKGNL